MKLPVFFAATLVAAVLVSSAAEAAHSMNTLHPKQQAIVTIAALSARGDLDTLKVSLNEGLDAGLTVNEIKELLVQLYAYAGFPRSLNAISAFQTVTKERKARGMHDAVGKEASPLPTDRSSLAFGTENQTRLIGKPVGGGIYDFVPAIDQFLKAHLFGDIFQRDNLDWKNRELATVAMLASMEGLEPQLQAHIQIGMHNGLTVAELEGTAAVLGANVDGKVGKNMEDALGRVLGNR